VLRNTLSRAEIARAQEEHFAGRLLGVEPDEGQKREIALQQPAATTDFADQHPLRTQMRRRPGQDPAHDIEPIGSAGMAADETPFAGDFDRGKLLFQQNCALCHSTGLVGSPMSLQLVCAMSVQTAPAVVTVSAGAPI